jgi:hypothetical protein
VNNAPPGFRNGGYWELIILLDPTSHRNMLLILTIRATAMSAAVMEDVTDFGGS